MHLATKLPSFLSAQESIAETIEVELTPQRVLRLTERVGKARVYEREIDMRRWEGLPLAQKLTAPLGVKPPAVACVSYDGGRMQRCDLPDDAKSHWCETKVGILLELEPSEEGDLCPELPDTFRNLAKMDKLTREIHLTAAEFAAPKGQVFGQVDAVPTGNEPPPPDSIAEVRETVVFKPPKILGRDVAASLSDSVCFGKQLAARAWSLGFAAAPVKAFVADGQAAN